MRALVLSFLVLPVAAAQAQTHPDTLRMSCSQAASVVQSHGSIVLSTGPNIYDRFTTGCQFCPDFDFADPAFVATRDNPQCPVGYVCRTSPTYAITSCNITGYRGP